jgi:large subunit ribosomal protein L17
MRFAMTARTVAKLRGEGKELNEMTQRNIEKVTQFRPGGEDSLEAMVEQIRTLEVGERNDAANTESRWGGKV